MGLFDASALKVWEKESLDRQFGKVALVSCMGDVLTIAPRSGTEISSVLIGVESDIRKLFFDDMLPACDRIIYVRIMDASPVLSAAVMHILSYLYDTVAFYDHDLDVYVTTAVDRRFPPATLHVFGLLVSADRKRTGFHLEVVK